MGSEKKRMFPRGAQVARGGMIGLVMLLILAPSVKAISLAQAKTAS